MEISIRFPPMQLFIDYVIDRYSQLDSECNMKGIDADVDECVRCCSDSYYEGDTQYECDNSKRVYLIKYMAAQIKQIDLALVQPIREDICVQQAIRALSLGGGPGTEAIALMDALGEYDKGFNLRFDNIDSERTWKSIYHDLTDNFARRVGNVKIGARFSSVDLAAYVKTVESPYDIVFVSWLLSLVGGAQGILGILKTLKPLIRQGGYLVIADRFEDKVVDVISSQLEKVSGLTLKDHDRQIKHCGVSFPDEIRDTFQVRLIADSAYWNLQRGI